ncbi:MAG: hypothetical protein KatS3mg087_1624 [Patescibacteria group bacterium]|nr:MAG: hypothetical protein KatS3mg087_1624 [Patescibacteria group bacterium]
MPNYEEIYTRAWNDNIIIGVQQMLSKFRDRVTVKMDVVGESTTFDVLGKKTARKKTSRHSKAVLTDPSLNRVHAYMDWYYDAGQFDTDDRLKSVVDPTSSTVRASIAAIERQIDEIIIDAINGTKYTGKNGTTASSLPSSQKIAAGGTGLTLNKLIQTLEILNQADVPDSEPKYFAISPKQLTDLLGISQITSADYNTMRTLTEGKVVSFLGFNFVLTNLLNTDSSNNRLCLAWTQSGVGLAIGQDIKATIKEGTVEDHLAWQYYAGVMAGATRIEDERVVEIACVEA